MLDLCSFFLRSDEEGDEEVRRRERELGIIPTSPSSLLSHLQIASPPAALGSPVGSPSDMHQPPMPPYPPGIKKFLLARCEQTSK